MQRDARALSEHTPGVEPMSDRRKRQRAESADYKEAACCDKGRNIVVTVTNGCSGFDPRRVLSDRRERDLHICSLRFIWCLHQLYIL